MNEIFERIERRGEIEIIVLDSSACNYAKDHHIYDMFEKLNRVKEGKMLRANLLATLPEPAIFFVYHAPEGMLKKYFDREEIAVIREYRAINEIIAREALREPGVLTPLSRETSRLAADLTRAFESVDFDTFANIILKLAILQVSIKCLVNPELAKRVFQKEFDEITKHFEKWKKGEISFDEFWTRTAKYRQRMNEKLSDLDYIVWKRGERDERD